MRENINKNKFLSIVQLCYSLKYDAIVKNSSLNRVGILTSVQLSVFTDL